MKPFSLENRVDNLIEARVRALPELSDADRYAEALAAAAGKFGSQAQAVLCADHRPVGIYRQEVADRLAALCAAMNTRLSRAAVLVSRSNATLVMQLERLVREARNPSRRVFFSASDAVVFMASELTPAAQERARSFLAEWTPRPEDGPLR